PDLPAIKADTAQIQQVFMNFVLNAAEAIGNVAGVISIRTGVQSIKESFPRNDLDIGDVRPGKYVYLEVRDTGCGMDAGTKSRIFDPFFTTKFTGRGLGLAAVSGIVRAHKGALKVTSTPGIGTCFSILFPALETGAVERAVPSIKATLRGSGTVLVVDDEETVREMARRALEYSGFKVLL